MTYTIGKSFTFSAAHYLPPPYAGKCTRLHGHTWTVEVVISGPLNCMGMVLDFNDFEPFRAYLAGTYDHQLLNDNLPMPTAENIAAGCLEFANAHWAGRPFSVQHVTVWESPNSWARVGRSNHNGGGNE